MIKLTYKRRFSRSQVDNRKTARVLHVFYRGIDAGITISIDTKAERKRWNGSVLGRNHIAVNAAVCIYIGEDFRTAAFEAIKAVRSLRARHS